MRPLRLGTVRCAEGADEEAFAVGEEGIGKGFLGNVVSDMNRGSVKEVEKRERGTKERCSDGRVGA
jgi:hypothetical protein